MTTRVSVTPSNTLQRKGPIAADPWAAVGQIELKSPLGQAKHRLEVMKLRWDRLDTVWDTWEVLLTEATEAKDWDLLGYVSLSDMLTANGIPAEYALRRQSQDVTPSNMLQTLKAAAAISDPEYGPWAYDEWERFNLAYFDGALHPGGISWGLTPHGHTLGSYEPWRNHITLHVSLVQPRGDAWGIGRLLGPRFALDVLLHEMIHQAIQQTHGAIRGPDGSHNNPLWCSEIVRLSPLVLGLEVKAEPVKLRRVGGQLMRLEREGFLSRRAIASWPYSLRPADYYEPAVAELASKVGNL